MPDALQSKQRVQVTLDPKVVDGARHLAKVERRSLSNMLEVLIEQAVKAHQAELVKVEPHAI